MYTIRNADTGDLEALSHFEVEISKISFREEAITDLEFHKKKLAKAMDKHPDGMFVMEADGMVCGWMWMEEKTNYLSQAKYMAFHSFYFKEDYRGLPCVDELLEYGLQYAEECHAEEIIGKVHAENLFMRSLYKKHRFQATHLVMSYRPGKPEESRS